jgi:hypothetical protein
MRIKLLSKTVQVGLRPEALLNLKRNGISIAISAGTNPRGISAFPARRRSSMFIVFPEALFLSVCIIALTHDYDHYVCPAKAGFRHLMT